MAFERETIAAIRRVASKYKVPEARLIALVDTESAGTAFAVVDGREEPLIRWEGHYFDRILPDHLVQKARAAGLAAPKWGVIKNPRSQQARWDRRLKPGMAIHKEAALSSCSWGMGQVMGDHWRSLGFSSAEDMVALARSGVEGQIELMMKFIVKNGLLDELQRGDMPAFFRGYNGSAWKKNGYGTAYAKAYKRATNGSLPSRPSSSGMLRMGSKGAKVREVQTLLRRGGFPINVDGDFGPTTRDAVRGFQEKAGLDVDGVVGPQTMGALHTWRAVPDEDPGKVPVTKDPDVGKGVGVGVGGGTILETANRTIDETLMKSGYALPDTIVTALTLVSAALVIGGLAYAGYKWWQKRQTTDGDEAIAYE